MIFGFQFGGSEAVITGIGDEFPLLKRYREWFVAGLFSFYYVVGLLSCTSVSFEYVPTAYIPCVESEDRPAHTKHS